MEENLKDSQVAAEQVEEVKEEKEVTEAPLDEEVKSDAPTDSEVKEEIKENKENSPKKEKGFFKKKEDPEKIRLQEENIQLKERVLRISAEMQNMKRRNEEKLSTMLKYEGEDFIKNLLPIVDNFERAINMDDTNLEDEVSKFLSGFKMIYGNLTTILQNNDVVNIDVLNKPFDPNTMEAVLVETVEGVEPNMVVDVLRKGYTFKGKVIRHAMVKVSK